MKRNNNKFFFVVFSFRIMVLVVLILIIALVYTIFSSEAKPVKAKPGDLKDTIKITEITEIKNGGEFFALVSCCKEKLKVPVKIILHGIKVPKFKKNGKVQNEKALESQKRLGQYLLHLSTEIKISVVKERREDEILTLISRVYIKTKKKSRWIYVNESLISDGLAEPNIPIST